MPLQINDRVKETSSTIGIVPIVLDGASSGYQNVASSISTSNTFPYVIELSGGSEWEIGIGSYVSGNNSIIRTQVLNSSNSGNIVNFSAGQKNVFISIPAAYTALSVRDLSQFATTTSANLASIISDETGSGKLVFSNNAVLVAPSIGVATGTSLTLSGNVSSNLSLVGSSANTSRFPNALSIVTNVSSNVQNENHNIGLIAEGVANASNSSIYGIGVYGVGYTNSGTRSGGVVGEGHVTSSIDGGSAIGVRGYASDTHVGGLNVGLYGDAANSSIGNYALAMNNGNILSNFVQTWYLNGGLTFTGGANTVTIPNLVSSNAYFSSANGTQPFTVVSNTVISNLNADLLDGQHGTYYTGLIGNAHDKANTGVTIATAAFSVANTETIGQAAFGVANTGVAIGQAGFTQANTGVTIATAAFSKANTETIGQAAFSKANTETIGQAAFGVANTGVSIATAAFGVANTGTTIATSAFTQANTGVAIGQAAYTAANTKYSSSGGTVSGSVTITTDLTVNGNVYLGGNVTTLSSNNLSINDPLIYLAQNNPANLQDIGLVGHFTSGTYQHTGFVRDATDGVWKLFSNVAAEPTTTMDFTGAIYDVLQVGTLNSSNANFTVAQGTTPFTVVSNTVVSNLNADFLDGQHGTYYTGLTGSAWSTANTGVTIGQAAFSRANTETIGQAAFGVANTGVTIGQAAFARANTETIGQAAFTQANTGVTIGQAAFGVANTGVVIATAAFTKANTGVTISTAGFGVANTGVTIGQAAFTAANTKYSSSGGTITGTVIVSASSSTDAFRITQTGTGNSFIVEDGTNPDSTPFVIDSAGNVGVGIGAPSAKLHVSGVVYSSVLNNPSYLLNSNGSDYGIIQNDSANTWSLARGTSPHVLATPVLTWTSNNQVGIGTTSPVSKLHALVTGASNGTINSRTALHIQNNNITTGTSNARIQFSYDPATPKAWIEAGVYGSDYLAFGSSAGATESMRIDSAGNVGIGTISLAASGILAGVPSATIHVNTGNSPNTAFGSNTAIRVSGALDGGNLSIFDIMHYRDSTAGTGWNVTATRMQQRIDWTWMAWQQFNGYGNPSGISWGTGSGSNRQDVVERMRLDSSGNLGIGTTSPRARLSLGMLVANKVFSLYDDLNTAFYGMGIDGAEYKILAPSAAKFTFNTYNVGADTTTARMTLDSSGNLGIGTSSPSEKLHVNGNLLLENNFAIKQKMANGTATNLIAIDSSNSFRVAGGYSTAVHIHPDATSDTYLHFNNSGSVVVGNNTTATNMYIQNGNLTIGNGTVNSGYKLQVNGSFAATTKSFVIDHPTKPDMKLRYGSLEGPENGVYVRGRLKDSNVIELPDYWTELVHEDTITVNLTAIGKSQDLWVEDIVNNTVIVGGDNINCFYTVFAERKDVEKLIVEF